MGGHISVGVRRKDGSFRTIGVWTNPLAAFLRERAFRLEGSLEPLDRFFARYLKDDADFGGPQDTVPGEYGFVLIDEMTQTITNMTNYSSLQWAHQMDLGYFSGRMYATQERWDEMAELRESVIRARYVFKNTRDYTYEDLPPFTTHEAMFSLMKELTLRKREVPLEEKIGKATEAINAVSRKLKAHMASGSTDRLFDLEIAILSAQMAVREIGEDDEIDPLFVEYELDFSAWKIIDLRRRSEADFLQMKTAVEACVVLTDEEQAAWQEEYDYRFSKDDEEN